MPLCWDTYSPSQTPEWPTENKIPRWRPPWLGGWQSRGVLEPGQGLQEAGGTGSPGAPEQSPSSLVGPYEKPHPPVPPPLSWMAGEDCEFQAAAGTIAHWLV